MNLSNEQKCGATFRHGRFVEQISHCIYMTIRLKEPRIAIPTFCESFSQTGKAHVLKSNVIIVHDVQENK